MLSNAYFIAKFRFDTAENEPAKNSKMHFSNTAAARYVFLQIAKYLERLRRASRDLSATQSEAEKPEVAFRG